MIIDAENTILGRLATMAAKKALLGEKVSIINAEKAIVSGDKHKVFAHYQQRYARGTPSTGPFFPRMPDRFVRRTVRGMLPLTTQRGREAYKRVLCYSGVPEQFKDQEITVIDAKKTKLPNTKYTTVRDITRNMGGSSQ